MKEIAEPRLHPKCQPLHNHVKRSKTDGSLQPLLSGRDAVDIAHVHASHQLAEALVDPLVFP